MCRPGAPKIQPTPPCHIETLQSYYTVVVGSMWSRCGRGLKCACQWATGGKLMIQVKAGKPEHTKPWFIHQLARPSYHTFCGARWERHITVCVTC